MAIKNYNDSEYEAIEVAKWSFSINNEPISLLDVVYSLGALIVKNMGIYV